MRAARSEARADLRDTTEIASAARVEVPEITEDASETAGESPDVSRNPSTVPAEAPAVDASSLKLPASAFEQAYESLLPELLALSPSEVVPINIGVPGAVTKAFGIQPKLVELKDRIAKALPEVDAGIPERLVTHALALSHAHTLFRMAAQGMDALPSLAAEGKDLRASLLRDAQALIQRRLIDADALRSLKPDNGYRNLAFDLMMLTRLLRGWPALSTGLTATRDAEIGRGQEIAAAILTLFDRRKALRANIEASADLRNRAFTSFSRLYEEARRVVVFLRWYERDADQLVPSLYAKHKDRKRKKVVKATPEGSPDSAAQTPSDALDGPRRES